MAANSPPLGSQFPQPPGIPLEYAHLAQRRPGLITAIGVVSIIVASLSIIGSGVSGLLAVGMYTFATAMTKMSMSSVSGPGASGASHATGPSGIPTPQRQPIIQALTGNSALSGGQLDQLDAILATSGRTLFPTLKADAAAADVDGLIREHGTLPPARAGNPGGDYFLLASGRLSLYEDRATFAPAGGGGPVTVRAADVREEFSAKVESEITLGAAAGPATSPATSPATLSPAAVGALVNRAKAISSKPLNSAQIAGLTSLLGSSTQQFVKPTAMPSAAALEITLVHVDAQGQAYIQFRAGSLVLSPQGQIVSQTVMPFNPFGGKVNINATPIALGALEALLSFALAIYLLIIGVVTLRQSPRGRSLHRVYIFLKVPLAIGGAACWMWMISSIVAGIAKSGPMAGAAPAIFWVYATPGIVQAACGCIYPIALIFALGGRTAREYYDYSQA